MIETGCVLYSTKKIVLFIIFQDLESSHNMQKAFCLIPLRGLFFIIRFIKRCTMRYKSMVYITMFVCFIEKYFRKLYIFCFGKKNYNRKKL